MDAANSSIHKSVSASYWSQSVKHLFGDKSRFHFHKFSSKSSPFPSLCLPTLLTMQPVNNLIEHKLTFPSRSFSPTSYFPPSSSTLTSSGTLWTTCPTWSTAWTTASTSRWAGPWWCALTHSNRLESQSSRILISWRRCWVLWTPGGWSWIAAKPWQKNLLLQIGQEEVPGAEWVGLYDSQEVWVFANQVKSLPTSLYFTVLIIIERKQKYVDFRRDETELVQKPVLEVNLILFPWETFIIISLLFHYTLSVAPFLIP